MIDMSIPVIVGTVVAEVLVVVSSFVVSKFLTRSDQLNFGHNIRAKFGAPRGEDALHSGSPRKTISYKDERESYFDHSATATQIKFECDTNDD
jgi:hypothetical protein